MPPASTSAQEAFDVSQHVGLVNLGNTCFFNSVLQATSATRALHSLFHPWGDLALPVHGNDCGMTTVSLGSRPVNRRRIPALLLTDEEAKRPIIPPLTEAQSDDLLKLLPLSNSFRFTLEKTWKETGKATNVRPASHSPKALLKLLARKFEQFGHYEQQDAHELLRLLLDAMRMEEMDFIKKVRPREPRGAQRQVSGQSLRSDSSSIGSLSGTEPSEDGTDDILSAAASDRASSRSSLSHAQGDVTPMATNSQHLTPEGDDTIRDQRATQTMGSDPAAESSDDLVWEDMLSLIDVLWGGQLASMVVCEGCRHVSHTYEDFLDLSLPLRPEDAASASLRERRANRVRLMTDRWRKPGTPASSVRSVKSTNPGDERETILKQTLRAEVASDTVAPAEGASRVSSDRFADGAVSADEDSHTPGSTSWSAWASTLGRSRSARPASTAPVKPATPAPLSDRDTIDMPDIASMALTPESSASCSMTGNEEVLRHELARSVEAKTKGSRDLLTALSNASRANSRAGSRSRDGITSRSNSPGVEKVSSARVETTDPEHSQGHLLTGLLHHTHQKPQREPSRRAQYIAKAFGEPGASAAMTASPSLSSAARDTFRSKVRADQATTGLAVALRAFTTSEVLSEENSFNCKRCWRRLNPAKGAERERLRRRRARKGKNPSGSEDSEDDDAGEAEDDEPSGAGVGPAFFPATSSTGPVRLVAPKPQRAASSLLNPLTLASSEDESSDAEAIVNSNIVVGEHLDAPGPSAVDLLEEGARTPGSRRSSAQPPESQFYNFSRPPSVVLPFGAVPTPTSTVSGQDRAAGVDEGTDVTPRAPADEVPRLLGGSTASSSPSKSMLSSEPSMKQTGSGSPGSSASADQSASKRARAVSAAGSTLSQSDRNVSESGNESDVSNSSANLLKSLHNGGSKMLPASALVRPATADSMQSADKTKMAPPSSLAIQRQLPKRSTQSIPRRALKRYLISSFPPILVFHLKRFQANNSTRSTSFFSSSGNSTFKKIDDVVTYPEWLDMAEWMAPPREDYDRYGNLKETSDPRVWEAYQKSLGERSLGTAVRQHVASSNESSNASHVLTNDSTDLKRKPSRWSRTFSRGPSGSSTNSASGLPAPSLSPSQSRVTSPAMGQTGFRSHSGEHATAAPSGPSRAHSAPSPLYRLYSVVAHHGTTMHGGHYTSYVLSDRCAPAAAKKGKDSKQTGVHKEGVVSGDTKGGRLSSEQSTNRSHQSTEDQRQWVHCSDSVIKPSTLEQVLRCKDAYMVWYERVA